MQKIQFLVITLMFSVVVLSCDTPQTEKPNVILIVADDLGYGDLGCYGQELIKTPTIDRLARDGMRFTRFYAASTVCAPSRAGLMIGKHMGISPIRGNGNHPLPQSEYSLGELMKEAGYQTAMIGKWGLGDELESDPNHHGFDYYYGYLNQIHAHNYYPEHLIENGDSVHLPNVVNYMDTSHWTRGLGGYATTKVQYSNDLFTEKALDYIHKNKDSPFFLYLPYTIPHSNGEAPKGAKWEVPDYGIYQDENWSNNQKGYAAMVTRLDSYIDQILKLLAQHDLNENTLILFTSDNGANIGNDIDRLFQCNGSLKGGKRDLYEGGIRVPMIAYWPAKIEAGGVSSQPAAFWDLLPTFGEVAGGSVPATVSGQSLFGLMTKQDSNSRNSLYFEYKRSSVLYQAIVQQDWKGLSYIDKNGNRVKELYNLGIDESEQTNLAEQMPEKINAMLDLMEEARIPHED